MTAFLAVMVLWVTAYIAAFGWLVVSKAHLVRGGIFLFAISLVPMIYGRWTTQSDWHDSPLMGAYYFPAFAASALSLIVIFVGVFIALRRALRGRSGAE